MDRTELLRGTIAILAFIVAGAQVAMRVMISNDFHSSRVRDKIKERTLSTTMVFLLAGVGLGNLTHLDAEPSTSTVLISLGVAYAAYSLLDIWRWGKEENGDDNPNV